MKKRWIVLGALGAFIGGVLLYNASFWARPAGDHMMLLAHRGVHQYMAPPPDRNTCSAAMEAPTHAFIENTIPSMRAAFDLGAEMVELDVHPTTDGEFAVFHDWSVECRTDGEGVTRELSMAYLRTLDVGYGYTADGGQTFPLRGQGIGLMPTLREVLTTFPDQRFFVNFKGSDPREGDLIADYLDSFPEARPERLIFFGAAPSNRLHELRPAWRTTSRERAKSCVIGYVLTGWYGAIPQACRNSLVGAPVNYAWLAWGWPNRFLERMQSVGTEVMLIGPLENGELTGNIDDAEGLARVPDNWRGWVETDRIEVITPLAQAR